MLKTNLFKKATDAELLAIVAGIKYEAHTMTCEMLTEKIGKLEARIAKPKKNTTGEILEGWKAELAILKAELETEEIKVAECELAAGTILETVNHTLLRIIACADAPKLEKYALKWKDEDEGALYDALCNIHEADIDKVKAGNFKKSTDIIEKIVRLNLTFPETTVSEKLAVRLNATDIRMLNEAFVQGYRNKYHSEKDSDEVEYVETKQRVIVGAHKKDGEMVYNWEKFNAIIVKIAIAKIANVQ